MWRHSALVRRSDAGSAPRSAIRISPRAARSWIASYGGWASIKSPTQRSLRSLTLIRSMTFWRRWALETSTPSRSLPRSTRLPPRANGSSYKPSLNEPLRTSASRAWVISTRAWPPAANRCRGMRSSAISPVARGLRCIAPIAPISPICRKGNGSSTYPGERRGMSTRCRLRSRALIDGDCCAISPPRSQIWA